MKKSICIIMSVAMILISFAACDGKIDENTPTKVNSDGEAYIELTKNNGEPLTDTAGQQATSILSDEDENKNDKNDKDNKKDNVTTTTTKKSNANDSVTVKDPIEDVVADKEDLLPTGTESKKTTLRDDVIVKAFKGNKFTISTSIVGGGQKIPTIIAVNGDEIASKITYDFQGNGTNMVCRMIRKDNTLYIALDTFKIYMKTEGSEEDNMNGIYDIGGDQTYVKNTEVKENGKKYICEEYNNKNGTTYKYYFEGKNWVRLEIIDDEAINVLEINSFNSTVDESLFSLKGLTEINENNAGQLGSIFGF